MATLDTHDGYEQDRAILILKAIGITRETPDGGMNAGLPENITLPIVCNAPPIIRKPHPNIPMPCCERAETRTKDCFTPTNEK